MKSKHIFKQIRTFPASRETKRCSLDTNPYNFDDFILYSVVRYIEDMNKALGLPAWLYENMLGTTWSQGVQTEQFDNVTVRYTYHPDKGMEVTYYLK